MKTKVLLLLSFFAISVQAQRGVRIGYIDMEYILENVVEYQETNAQLTAKVQKWKIEIEQKKSKVEQMKKDLNAEKVLLTKELILEKEEDIQILEKEMLEYQQARFGPEGDLVIQKRLLVQPLQDQVFNAVQEIASTRRYDFIFDKSADVVMLYSDKKYDISDLVLKRINVTRKKGERIKRNKANELDKFNAVPNPEVEARKQAAEDKRTQRAKDLEERRQQKLKEREALKKAYDDRRKKLLAEKEAKKKAALEAREKKKKENEEKKKNNNNNN